tara:strand:+ start:185 stop:601 length:417 start_codon:yes stop_codon:yes gene_type:complete
LTEKLKLLAYDAKDFEILSALLQDSIMPVMEMNYSSLEKQFIVITSRFDWDNKINDGFSNRILSGLCFFNVEKISKKNFPSLKSEQILNFLTLFRKDEFINIVFSGDIELKLFGTKIYLRLDDLNKEWPTIFIPNHEK